jgi:hypothetical protein
MRRRLTVKKRKLQSYRRRSKLGDINGWANASGFAFHAKSELALPQLGKL